MSSQYQLMPDLTTEEYEALKADIKARGVLVAVEYDDQGNLLDGHHRVRACGELGIVEWPKVVRSGLTEAEKVKHVVALNAARRHLNESQRAMLAAMIANRLRGDNQHTAIAGTSQSGAADLLNVSTDSVGRARKVIGQGADELQQAVTRGKVAVSAAAAITDLPRAEQVEIVARGEREIIATAKRLQEERREQRRQQRAETPEPPAPILLPSDVRVLCQDSRHLQETIATESIHLVVTSPPYNVGKDYREYEDRKSLFVYLRLLAGVWSEAQRVLVPGGRICVNVPHGTDRNPYFPIGAYVTRQLAKRFNLLGTIIWDKGSTGNRTSWGSWRLPTAPSLRDTCELVIIAAKPGDFAVPLDVLMTDDGKRVSPWLDSDTFTTLTQDHWQIAPESAERIGHPAPFPVELAERLMRLYAFPGSHVLDPFAGSGTVGVAALRLGAKATLIDIDEEYCDIARRRCYAEAPAGELSEQRQAAGRLV